jgi:hypothetical protein
MNYFSKILLSSIKKELIFEVMKDLRIGGLNPDNFDDFMTVVKALLRKFKELDNQKGDVQDFMAFIEPEMAIKTKLFYIKHNLEQFELSEISEKDKGLIFERITKILDDRVRFCWHPMASKANCTLDNSGKVKISRAHSIQRGKILKRISEDNKVRQFRIYKNERDLETPIKRASTFWGFCDKHDKIFDPIEKEDLKCTPEQLFLFAYRAFINTAHVKIKFYEYYDFGEQAKNDQLNNKVIFDQAIVKRDYSAIRTDILVLDNEYPLAVSTASDLDYDFFANCIPHSEARLEQFYLSIFPEGSKTYVLFSYLKEDSGLYGNIVDQIRYGNEIESKLSVLVAGHCENVFFKPSYYDIYIRRQEESISKLVKQTQTDFVGYDGYGRKLKPISNTPPNYLKNEFEIKLFN